MCLELEPLRHASSAPRTLAQKGPGLRALKEIVLPYVQSLSR